MSITINNYGLANIGNDRYKSQGTRGGYEFMGKLRIDFDDHGYAIIGYYNNPSKAIPYKGKWYFHDDFPAYMIKWEGDWHVGTYEQIEKLIKSNRKHFE